VASAVGLIDPAPGERISFVDGRDLPALETLSKAEARDLLAAPVIARATPRQKLELIELHQRSGEVVAMTGDGVNDAPALKKADIGIAMGLRGTQVAREAADMVLLDDELGTIVEAVAQGRAIFANLCKFVVYLMSCNVSEIFAVGLGAVAQGPLPLLPLQILFLNLVTDVFPALALGVCEGSPALMRERPRDPREPMLTQQHWRSIFGLGFVIAVSVLAALGLAVLWLDMPAREATTVSFLTLALAQLWHVFSMRNPRSGWVRNEVTRNPWVWGALALCLALLLVAVHWPPLARVLSTANPGVRGWGLALSLSFAPLVAGQLTLTRAAGRPPDQARAHD
jgi:Ca2+-transporting ATPase